MKPAVTRRQLMVGAASGAVMLATPAWATVSARDDFRQLESELGGRLGLWALDTGDHRVMSYRDGERFPFCSTFKVLLVGAILQQSQVQPGLLKQHIVYGNDQLVTYSPITEQHVEAGMSVEDLCAAGLQYSDNTAANLLMRIVGGPSAVTAYARTLGDAMFRLDRYEPALNSAILDDPRDTTTPQAMGASLQRLALGEALEPEARERLQTWLKGNTTGGARIRAAVPGGWVVADKTGSGDFGVANDVGIIWPPGRAPWIVSIYTQGRDHAAPMRNDIIAAAAGIVIRAWAS